MRRFYSDDIAEDSSVAVIKGAELRHMKTVLRLAPGDRVIVFNGKGVELVGEIEQVKKGEATVKVLAVRDTVGVESPVKLTLLQGLVKGGKPEVVMQKATELGAAEVVFFTTGRTVPKPAETARRLERYQRIALEAVKQCGRTIVPEVKLAGFDEVIKGRSEDLLIVFHRGDGSAGAGDILDGFDGASVAIMVGPEGGFTDEEAEAALEAGFKAVSLGLRTLRSETAAVAALSIVQYAIGGFK